MPNNKYILPLVLILSLIIAGTASFQFLVNVDWGTIPPEQSAQEHLLEMTRIHARQLASRLGRTESVVRASAKFAEMIWRDAEYLFSIEMQHQKNLDQGEITEALVEDFARNSHKLSSKTEVIVEKKSGKWAIDDTTHKNQYSVIRFGNKLNVYKTTIPYVPSYYHDRDVPPKTCPSDIYVDPRYKTHISTQVSCYKIAPKAFFPDYQKQYLENSTLQDDPLDKVDHNVWKAILNTSKMDIIWRYLYASYPEHGWLYMGFDLGFHRSFPWHKNENKTYDPRIRPWYVEAQGKDIAWSTPYVDASGLGMIITASKSVTVDGNFIGVVAADLTLTDLIKYLHRFELTPHGYNFILDRGGIAVIHPAFAEKEPGDWEEKAIRVPIENLEITTDDFMILKAKMLQGKACVGVVDYPHKKMGVAFAPIGNTPLNLATVAPITDLVKVKFPDNTSSLSLVWYLWIPGIVTGIIIGVLILLVVKISNQGTTLSFLQIMMAVLLTVIGIVSGILGKMFFTNEYNFSLNHQQILENLHKQTLQQASTIDEFLYRIGSITTTVGGFARHICEKRHLSHRPSFFHDPDVIHAPSDITFSTKHKRNISAQYSTFKVVNSAYNDPQAYHTAPEAATYGQWPEKVQEIIAVSADLDIMFVPMYESMEEILWIYMGFEEGIHRVYPYHGPIARDYDPRQRPWYRTCLESDPDNVTFTTPFLDAGTGKIIITSALKVQDNQGKLIGVVGVDFQLETIQQAVLAMDIGKSGRIFLINQDFHVMAHSNHALPKTTWTERDFQIPIEEYETGNKKLLSILKQAKTGKTLHKIIDYEGTDGKCFVSLAPLQRTGMILGQVIPYSQISMPHLYQRKVVLPLIILDFILVALLFVSIKRHRLSKKASFKKCAHF